MYGISHPVQAFYFDRAIWIFGTSLEAELENVGMDTGGGKKKKAPSAKQLETQRSRIMQKWLGTGVIGFRQPEVTKHS